MRKLTILPGEIYKNLSVIEEIEPDGKYRRFKTKCIKCGNVGEKYMNALLHYKTGCACGKGRKNGSIYSDEQKKLYGRYLSIKFRCSNKKYKYYGGRGIKCKWKTFIEFWNDMGGGYYPGLTIDRIDNNGDYCKENCRWADKITQNNNRRNNLIIEDGLSLTQWLRDRGLEKHFGMAKRLYKKGVPPKDILNAILSYISFQ